MAYIVVAILLRLFLNNSELNSLIILAISLASAAAGIADLIYSRLSIDLELLMEYKLNFRAIDNTIAAYKKKIENKYGAQAKELVSHMKEILGERKFNKFTQQFSEEEFNDYREIILNSSSKKKDELLSLLDFAFEQDGIDIEEEEESIAIDSILTRELIKINRDRKIADTIIGIGVFFMITALTLQDYIPNEVLVLSDLLTLISFFVIVLTWFIKDNYRHSELQQAVKFRENYRKSNSCHTYIA